MEQPPNMRWSRRRVGSCAPRLIADVSQSDPTSIQFLILITWNVAFGRGTANAFDIADQLAADVVLLQEALIDQQWHGPGCSGQVQQRGWGSSVFVRDGSLEPIAIPRYSGWVIGA